MHKLRKSIFLLFGGLFVATLLPAQSYQYELSWQQAESHWYNVKLTADPAGRTTDFQLPAWRPGRYYLQDYAAAVAGFAAVDAAGNKLQAQKVDNDTWRVESDGTQPITVEYWFYANTMDAGSSVLDHSEAYFNPVNLFMHVRDRYAVPCTLRVTSMPDSWKAATAMKRQAGVHNVFMTADYHEFVDCPTILSPTLKTLHSRIGETDFYFHFQGQFPDDKATEDAYQMNMGRMIREQIAIFGQIPTEEYHFIYHLLPFNIGHAVEHKNSSSYALPASVATSPERIARVNSISSHEFFHLWNVKRIRPAVMVPYDYQKEAHTTLHWFTEGVTDYYTSLALQRCGLYARETYYGILARTIEALENNYAAKVISPSQSSWDSWLSRSEYTPPYHRISYYTLGSRSGLLLDLEIRKRTEGKKSLDDVFRALFKDYYEAGKGVGERDIQKVCAAVTGSSFDAFFDAYIHGTKAIDYDKLFAPFGLELEAKPRKALEYEALGIAHTQPTPEGINVRIVLPGTDAAKAGIQDNDVITEINGTDFGAFDAKEFFDDFKKPVDVALKVRRHDGEHAITVRWTGTHVPMRYSLAEKKKLKKGEEAMLEGWLGSKQ